MVTYPSGTQVTEVARWLEQRRSLGQSTTLFLGARAGGLFRSKTLYSTSQYFSPRTFTSMSRIEQFGECYRVLHQQDFSKSDIDTILIASLQGLEVSETDMCLSELVKTGIFDTIISTNIDNLLTRAFLNAEMREQRDFQVFIPQKDFIEDIAHHQSNPLCLLIKIFGDLASGEYNLIRHDLYLDAHEKLKAYLTSLLQGHVLMLGYDPYWDRSIDAVFSTQGQELCYINEGQIEPSVWFALQQRKGRYLTGGEGNYEQFIRALHWQLMSEEPPQNHFMEPQATLMPESVSFSPPSTDAQDVVPPPSQLNATQTTLPVLSNYEKEQRKRVCIVWSKKDKVYFNQFQRHLARYEREKLLDVWSDAKIEAGQDWHREIQNTLAITRVAILLVSADFLASSFIAENILPPLLEAAEAGGAIILPVILSHCVIEDTPLHPFQPFNALSEPLVARRVPDRDKVWADLVRYMITLVKDS